MMQVDLGYYQDGSRAVYDLARASNPHMCVIGMSGAGKTHTIRQVLSQLNAYGATVICLDGQGDMVGLPNSVDTFFLAGGEGGSVNPMRVESDNEINKGAVLIAIRQVLTVVRMFAPNLGVRQEADLHLLLEKTYLRFGILDEDSSTWEKQAPVLSDLLDDVIDLRRRLETNMEHDIFKELRNARRSLKRAEDKDKEGAYERAREHLTELIGKLVERGLHDTLTERRWDLKRIESLEHVLGGMVRTGLFRGDDVRMRRGMINRFDLNKLHQTDQMVMYHLLLDRVFHAVRRNCTHLNPKLPSIFIVLDEGKLASAGMDGFLSPLNRIATEGRKYGLALIMGVQSPKHLSDDAFDNFGMTLLLKINHNAQDRISRLFKIRETTLQSVEPRVNALYSFNGARFQTITFAEAQNGAKATSHG